VTTVEIFQNVITRHLTSLAGGQRGPGEPNPPTQEARDFIRELQAEDPTATPAEIRQRYQEHVRFRTEFKDDAVESEMIAILDEWLQTVVPD
jgi:hypothetical protein